jgi:cytochrome c oxidase subunit 2
MIAKIKVVTQEEFDAQLEKASDEKDLTLAQKGQKAFSLNGCISCHNIEKGGKAGTGPALFGKFGTEETLVGGAKVMIDENYIRESIMDPAAKVVNGFSPVMPPFQGRISEQDLAAIIEFIKSLK